MNSLMVLGNGFDLAHGIASSYSDFYQFWQQENPDSEVSSSLQASQQSQWQNFEADLASIDLQSHVGATEEIEDPDLFEEALEARQN